MHNKIQSIVEAKWFQNFIVILIVLSGVTMGMATSKDIMASPFGVFIHWFDIFVISVFTIEITLRIYVYKKEFFKDPWSLFDFSIVAISLIPASAGFEILRILRVLRLFRLITVVPSMRKIVTALLGVIPSMLSISALMALVFYVFAIMATQLYSETFPQWFGTLGDSFYTLFQVMTLESWSMGIVRPIMEQHPYAWMFFIPFIFIATFVMINLIIAVVVDAMGAIQDDGNTVLQQDIEVSKKCTIEEVQKIRDDISELKQLILVQNQIKEF
ncbi:MAG: ion transporter [Helicobacteraceae bacterium]|nr:ion transporter [Candidatus Sulfurimonas ponti]MBL6973336.1 ion transporter [Sulfurimonas sp.]